MIYLLDVGVWLKVDAIGVIFQHKPTDKFFKSDLKCDILKLMK